LSPTSGPQSISSISSCKLAAAARQKLVVSLDLLKIEEKNVLNASSAEPARVHRLSAEQGEVASLAASLEKARVELYRSWETSTREALTMVTEKCRAQRRELDIALVQSRRDRATIAHLSNQLGVLSAASAVVEASAQAARDRALERSGSGSAAIDASPSPDAPVVGLQRLRRCRHHRPPRRRRAP